jgi:zinc transport system permease protein
VDLLVILAVFVFGVLALLRLWPVLAYSTFDSQLAQTDGVNVRRLEYLLFMLAALITVVSAQVVGVVLMAAYLVIPAAAARLLSSSLIGMTLRSVSAGLVTTVSGLLLSFYLDVPSGSMIILSQAALFIAAAVLRKRN